MTKIKFLIDMLGFVGDSRHESFRITETIPLELPSDAFLDVDPSIAFTVSTSANLRFDSEAVMSASFVRYIEVREEIVARFVDEMKASLLRTLPISINSKELFNFLNTFKTELLTTIPIPPLMLTLETEFAHSLTSALGSSLAFSIADTATAQASHSVEFAINDMTIGLIIDDTMVAEFSHSLQADEIGTKPLSAVKTITARLYGSASLQPSSKLGDWSDVLFGDMENVTIADFYIGNKPQA